MAKLAPPKRCTEDHALEQPVSGHASPFFVRNGHHSSSSKCSSQQGHFLIHVHMPKTVSRSRCPSGVSGSGGARVGEMGATGGGEGKGSALPHTVMSHSAQPEKQSRDRDRDRAQPQPRDGQTTRGNGQVSVRQELSSRFPPT